MAAICTCSAPNPTQVDGQAVCGTCGERLSDPRDRLLVLIARQQKAILARLDRLEDNDEQGTTDRLLEPAELARRLGRSRQWVYDHAQQLGAIRVGDGPRPRLHFDLDTARERLAVSAEQNGSSRPPKSKPRKRRSSGDVDLLPIGGRKP